MELSAINWIGCCDTQDKSLRITHNLTIFGGCGLILSIITGLFGINVDGIPGAKNTPYAFALFSGLLFLIGFMLIIVGIVYFGLQKPVSDEQVQVRKLELQQLVSMFQHEAETHAKVREGVLRSDLPPRAADLIYDNGDACLLISPASKITMLLLIYFCYPSIIISA